MSWALAPLSWAFGLLSCRWRQGRAWRWGNSFSQAFWPVKKSTLTSWKPCCWWVPEGGCCSKTALGIGEEGDPYRTDTPVRHCSQLTSENWVSHCHVFMTVRGRERHTGVGGQALSWMVMTVTLYDELIQCYVLWTLCYFPNAVLWVVSTHQ